MGFEMRAIAYIAVLSGFCAAATLSAPWPASADDQQRDAAFANRVFAGAPPRAKNYACFVRRYDAEHLAQHPLQKVSVMKLLIAAEHVADDPVLEYSFRLGVNFRDRPGNFDSSGDCGHAPTIEPPDNPDIPPEDKTTLPDGIDFSCGVDCDGGGITVNLAHNDTAVIVKLERVRIWKGKDPDDGAETALQGGADDKVFRLDRTSLNECAALAYDRKELAALRHK